MKAENVNQRTSECVSETQDVEERAFAVAAPRLWNHLPLDVRSAPSISAFKSRLKTHLYSLGLLVP